MPSRLQSTTLHSFYFITHVSLQVVPRIINTNLNKLFFHQVDLEIGDCVAVHLEESKAKVKQFVDSIPVGERSDELQGKNYRKKSKNPTLNYRINIGTSR